MPYRYLIAPGVAHVDKFVVTVHDVQSLVGQHDQRIRVIADEPDFNGGIYGRREFEQHGTGDGIGIVGLHVGIKVLFYFLLVYLLSVTSTRILAKLGLGTDGSGGQIVTQRVLPKVTDTRFTSGCCIRWASTFFISFSTSRMLYPSG